MAAGGWWRCGSVLDGICLSVTLPNRPFADPEKAVRKLLEIANTIAPVDGCIHVEKIIGTISVLPWRQTLHPIIRTRRPKRALATSLVSAAVAETLDQSTIVLDLVGDNQLAVL